MTMTEEKQELKQHLYNKLEELSNSLVTDPEKMKLFIAQWSNGFHQYSLGNLLLIMMQKPDATLCAGYRTWLSKNRQVRKGEKSLAILAPRFKKIVLTAEDDPTETEEYKLLRGFMTVSVFDVSQTDGEPVDIGHSQHIIGADWKIADVVKHYDYKVLYDAGLQHENGFADVDNQIHLAGYRPDAAQVACFYHEAAHIKLGHTSTDNDTPRETRELEAEAVAYLCCCFLGIDNNKSAMYIANWHGDKEKLQKSGQHILKTAEQLIRVLTNDKEE